MFEGRNAGISALDLPADETARIAVPNMPTVKVGHPTVTRQGDAPIDHSTRRARTNYIRRGAFKAQLEVSV